MKIDFICYHCDRAYGGGEVCVECGEPLAIRSLAEPARQIFSRRPVSMWDYAALLPVADGANIVSLGEGGTPLVDAPRLAASVGLGQVVIKNEMTNPTGSFKDRQISAGISHAKEIGAGTVAVVSSGNVACAAAAYAARAGMNAVMFMHGHAASSKVAMASLFGGRVIQVDTPSARAVFDLCISACNKFGWYHLSTAGMYNAYNVEGSKTIAYEVYQQTAGHLPEWVVAPVGGGGLLGGIWRGFLDLERLGLIEKPPRLAGVQATGCAPLKQAIESGASFLETLKHPWPNPKTIAGGIADDILFDGHTVLPAIRATGGAAIAVDDDATLEGLRQMAALEGLLCEPTSAVAMAALSRLPGAGAKTRVCCVITGSGAKDFSAAQAYAPVPLRIGPSLEELDRALAG
ncbi:MAG TPA: threonine synthase [Candidatus Bathyarchaeia archaeon]|nr:threonine synthase [Candidatus Bathyarchaeia archaeon]